MIAKFRRVLIWMAACCLVLAHFAVARLGDARVQTFNDDGAWCWYEDERVLVVGDWLLIGSVAAGSHQADRNGDIEAAACNVVSGSRARVELHHALQRDDHDSPAFVARPDGRILVMYCKHGGENKLYYRVSTRPGDPTEWEPEKVFIASTASRVTYSNLHYLPAEGRIYDFFRGYDNTFKPSWMYSDDLGESWTAGGLLVDFTDPDNPTYRHRPYVKYVSDGSDTVHFTFTEGHPAEYRHNSIYHAFYRGGKVYQSDGTLIGSLADGPILPASATQIYAGDLDHNAWTADMQLDASGFPYVGFTERRNRDPLDLRYHYARWDGAAWHEHEIAHAGWRLYAGQDDYTGNLALDPADPDRVFISSNVDPDTGALLASGHYELFVGRTHDFGAHFDWAPLTPGASSDNLRPIVPVWSGGRTALLWMQGTYSSYTSFNLAIVGTLQGVAVERTESAALNINLGGGSTRDRFGPAYGLVGGASVVAASEDFWNGAGAADLPAGGFFWADGRDAPEISYNVGTETQFASGRVVWSGTRLVSRSGGSPEGIQNNGAGGFASLVMQTYVREDGESAQMQRPGIALAGLPEATWQVFIVADNTFHTQDGDHQNRAYKLYCGVDAATGPTDFTGFASARVANTDWSAWKEGETYVRFSQHVPVGQSLVLVSEDELGGEGQALFNLIQLVRELPTPDPDLNHDGQVDEVDVFMLLSGWHRSALGDVNGDGTTDAADLLGFAPAWKRSP